MPTTLRPERYRLTSTQIILSIRLCYRIHSVSFGHRINPECFWFVVHHSHTHLYRPRSLVSGSWSQYSRRLRCGQEQGRHCRLSPVCILCRIGLFVLHFLSFCIGLFCKIICNLIEREIVIGLKVENKCRVMQ